MIISVRGRLANSVLKGRFAKGFPPDLAKKARAMFSVLDAAADLEDLRLPPGNRLEALIGDRAGKYSVRINDKWRVCFLWTDLGPKEVEIVDYH